MSQLKMAEIGSINQALFTGQVVNDLTGESVTKNLQVEVNLRYPGETDFRAFIGVIKVAAGGYFAAYGVPQSVLPLHLDPLDTVDIQINISADGYTDLETVISLTASDVIPVETTLDFAGHTLSASIVSAPLIEQKFNLLPIAVGLNGLVIEDNDLESPVDSASVRIIAPVVSAPVISDTQGRFRIEILPLTSSVEIEVDLAGDITLVEHLIDYAKPFNNRIISLNG